MLKRIHIENFKSLKNVTLDLQPVNLLIGPNNSGKSNLLKALEFFDKYDDETQFSGKINNIIFKQKEDVMEFLLSHGGTVKVSVDGSDDTRCEMYGWGLCRMTVI